MDMSNVMEGMKMKISFSKEVKEEKELTILFNRLRKINMQDRKKREIKRCIPKRKKDKVRKTIFATETELQSNLSINLTNLSVTVVGNTTSVVLTNKITGVDLTFPLWRWRKFSDDREKHATQLEEGQKVEREHIGGRLYSEVNGGEFYCFSYSSYLRNYFVNV